LAGDACCPKTGAYEGGETGGRYRVAFLIGTYLHSSHGKKPTYRHPETTSLEIMVDI
jgi:hypothetical protein